MVVVLMNLVAAKLAALLSKSFLLVVYEVVNDRVTVDFVLMPLLVVVGGITEGDT